VIWEHPVAASFDVWALPNGNYLCSTLNGPQWNGVLEITPAHEEIFAYYTSSEVFGCQPLPNGIVLIGELDPCRLVEVNRQGQIQLSLQLHSSSRGHGSMRMPRRLLNGNYLVCHMEDHAVREYLPSGEIVREIPSPGPVFVAIRLENEHTLFSSEEAIIEVDAENNVVWEVTAENIPEAGIRLLTGLQRLPNGNTVVCNWLGHGQEGKGIPLFEITPAKKLVWCFNDVTATRNVGNFQLLDIAGNPLKGEILR
jgi:hypothetical protein